MTVASRPARFAIITVVRNDRAGLARTHASLRAQTSRDFAWIVIDGGSVDGTQAYLARHARDLAWWRSGPDGGIYDAMNAGLDAAAGRGDYLIFLNAGDTLAAPDTLAAIAAAAASVPGGADFLYGDALEDTEEGWRLHKPARSHRQAWYGMFTHHQAMVYRQEAVRGLRYSLDYAIGADYAFTLEALDHARTVVRVSAPLCIVAPAGQSRVHADVGRRDQARIRRDRFGYGRVCCWGIGVLQWLALTVRHFVPALFAVLRCRRWRAAPSLAYRNGSVDNLDGASTMDGGVTILTKSCIKISL